MAAAVVALLLSACQIRQEIRFNVDGSGTATLTVGIDQSCQPPSSCPKRFERLLSGEGPVANAQADAEGLPFDIVIEPFASGPPDSPVDETGYTLSFDFTSLEDLEQKLSPDPSTGRSQTSAFPISGVTFEVNEDKGFTFTARVSVPGGGPRTSADHLSFAVVLPGREGEHNATEADDAGGATRFQWNYEAGQDTTTMLKASTCSSGGSQEGKDACGGSSLIPVGLVVTLVAAAVFAFALRRRQKDERGRLR